MKGERTIKHAALGALIFLVSIIAISVWELRRVENGGRAIFSATVVDGFVIVSCAIGSLAALFYVMLVVKAFWAGLTGADKPKAISK